MAEEESENSGSAPESLFGSRARRRRSRGPRPRILLADDNPETRDMLGRVLMARYDVETVADGAAALAALQRQRPDLVLTDATMPHVDGLMLVRKMREDPCTALIPVLLLSASVGEDIRGEALRAGADDFLEKPFSTRELLACVRGLLQKRPPPVAAPPQTS
jgi:CheY-like chemotaxis protein